MKKFFQNHMIDEISLKIRPIKQSAFLSVNGFFCGNVLIVLEGSQKQIRKIDLTYSNILIFVGFLLLELKSYRNEKSKKTLIFFRNSTNSFAFY